MTVESVKDISAEVFKMVLMVSGPVLLVSLLVGLGVSFLQAVTQIQEFTLTFVPKIIAVFLCLYILFPWFSRVLTEFTARMIGNIPMYIR